MTYNEYLALRCAYPTLRSYITACFKSGEFEGLYDLLFGLVLNPSGDEEVVNA